MRTLPTPRTLPLRTTLHAHCCHTTIRHDSPPLRSGYTTLARDKRRCARLAAGKAAYDAQRSRQKRLGERHGAKRAAGASTAAGSRGATMNDARHYLFTAPFFS